MMEMDDVSFLDAQLFLRFQRLQKIELGCDNFVGIIVLMCACIRQRSIF